jgi:hypothetical protein
MIEPFMLICYWWLTIQKGVVNLFQICDICQRLKPMWRNGKGLLTLIMSQPYFERV